MVVCRPSEIDGNARFGFRRANQTVDCLVTRFKMDDHGNIMHRDRKPILEFLAVLREGESVWAIPGSSLSLTLTYTCSHL
jgi:hypothetical protein